MGKDRRRDKGRKPGRDRADSADGIPSSVTRGVFETFQAHNDDDIEGVLNALEPLLEESALDAAINRLCDGRDPDTAAAFRTLTRRIAASTFMKERDADAIDAQVSLFAIACHADKVGMISDWETRKALTRALTGSGAIKERSTIVLSPIPVVTGWLSGAPPSVLRKALLALFEPAMMAIEAGSDVDDYDLDLDDVRSRLVNTPAYITPNAILGLRVMPTDGKCPCCGMTGDVLYGLDENGVRKAELLAAFEAAVAAEPLLTHLGIGTPGDVFQTSSRIAAGLAMKMIGSDASSGRVVHTLFEPDTVVVAGGDGRRRMGRVSIPKQFVEADPDAFIAALGRNVEIHADDASLRRAVG